jgi:hypothetical protein
VRPIEKVLDRLHGVRQHYGYFMAFCPAHDDRRHRSLSVREGRDGRVLIKCFAGCTAEEIANVLGLQMRDLFEAR